MDKNFLQDVIPPAQKKSIRNIPIPKGRRGSQTSTSIRESAPHSEQPSKPMGSGVRQRTTKAPPKKTSEPFTKMNFSEKPRKWKRGIFKLAILFILIIGFVSMISTFGGAELSIYPKQADATIDTVIGIENVDDKINPETLGFRLIEVTKENSQTVEASEEEEVNQKASGTIVISNNYSSTPQKLVRNTRFESTNGNIYRINTSVTIPGKTDDTAGTLEVEIFADETGEKFNIESSPLIIPGFEGLEQYETITAKTKTPVTGGFSGIRKIVSEGDLNTAIIELKTSLEANLISLVEEQLSDEFTLVLESDGASLTFGSPDQTNQKESSVDILLSGTIRAYIFTTSELSNAIAKNTLSNFEPTDDILITDFNEIKIVLSPDTEGSISATGRAHFVWQTDDGQLSNNLVSVPRKELKNVLQSFPSITRAEASIKPFWKRSFPKKADKIMITEVLE